MANTIRQQLDMFGKNTFGQIAALNLGDMPAGTYAASAVAHVGAALPQGAQPTRGSHMVTVNGVNRSGEFGAGPIVNDPTGFSLTFTFNHQGGPLVVESRFRVNNYDGGAFGGSRLDVWRVS